MDNTRLFFTDLTDAERNVRPSYYFMMRSLLHSRVDTGLTAEDGEEEDVNVYLAHLLQAFGDPVYLESAKPYLHRYDHEVFDRLTRSTDARLKYKIYKTNADFLLISMGVFDDAAQTLLGGDAGGSGWNGALEPTEQVTMSRGRTYYRFAYEYSQLVSRKRPSMTDVLDKLAKGFDRYTQILAHLRGEYLDLVHQLSQGELYHLERTVNRGEIPTELREAQDAFLDAWATWRRIGGDEHRRKLDAAIEVLRQHDPTFSFTPETLNPEPFPDDNDGDDEVDDGPDGT